MTLCQIVEKCKHHKGGPKKSPFFYALNIHMREQIIEELKTVYDPEMPSINIMDLGLVYDIDIKDKDVTITHTLTSIFCPMADEITKNIKEAVERVKGVEIVTVTLTHTPPFTKEMMSEEARLTLNI